MQNSNKSYKPKSSKYSRSEDLEESKDQSDDLSDTLGGGSDLKGIPTIVICQRENRQRGRSGRGRDEGRPPFNKSGERRGGRGNRGGPFRSRSDRDGESIYPRNKESTSRGSSYKHSNDVDIFKNKGRMCHAINMNFKLLKPCRFIIESVPIACHCCHTYWKSINSQYALLWVCSFIWYGPPKLCVFY
jgi:hypothetical protein